MSRFATSLSIAFSALALLPIAPDPTPLRGFTMESAQREREWEDKFRAIPEPRRMRDAMQRMSAHPHHVGTAFGKQNAEWIRDQFASYGWDVHIEDFDVLFPTPTSRVVELTRRSSKSRPLREIRRQASTPSNCPRTTPIRSMATSPGH
jgi:N-acetylated-alpha-linked acidic dipeptidase